MKKQLLTVLITLYSLFSIGQNWTFLGGKDTLNFNKNDILSLIVDSSNTAKTFLTFKEVINDTIITNGLNPVTEHFSKPNIFGRSLLKRNDSSILVNQNGDSLYFQLNVAVGHRQRVYFKPNRILYAVVDSIIPDSIYQNDSLKYFSFMLEDSTGVRINHPINHEVLIISKLNGVRKTIYWYHFPLNLDYMGHSKFERVFIDLGLTNKEFYDFELNSIYHLREMDYSMRNSPMFQPDNYTNQEIIRKQIDTINELVNYQIKIERDKYDYHLVSNMGPLITIYTFERDTIYQSFPYNNSNALAALGYQPINLSDSSISTVDIKVLNIDNRISFTYQATLFDLLSDPQLQKWAPQRYRIKNKGQEIQGICSFDGYRDGHNFTGSYHIKNLIYYQSNNNSWGNPRIVTKLDELNSTQESLFYPNPAQNKININAAIPIIELQIFNMNGQLVQHYIKPSNEIDLSALENGLYFIQAIDQQGEKFNEKLIINQ